jgi:hypothetical protein
MEILELFCSFPLLRFSLPSPVSVIEGCLKPRVVHQAHHDPAQGQHRHGAEG